MPITMEQKKALWSNVKCEWFHQVCMKIDQDIVDQPALKYNCKLCLAATYMFFLYSYIIFVPQSRLGGWEDLLDELARTLLLTS